jgi:hypothetical protein
MSLNSFVNNLSNTSTDEKNTNSNTGMSRGSGGGSKLEIMDDFLNANVVNKYQQPWRNLTTFLKKNRMKHFFDSRSDDYPEETQQKIIRRLSLGKIENKLIEYNSDIGEITSINVN